jgi:ERCC4-related helicase
LLEEKIILMSELALMVFDEVHHAVKNHPFNRVSSE